MTAAIAKVNIALADWRAIEMDIYDVIFFVTGALLVLAIVAVWRGWKR